jgi:phytoene dehydrogenase-like protein
VANVLPASLGPLAGLDTPRLRALQAPVDAGWGAVMLYRSVADGELPAEASHFMLAGDPASPLVDGNHTFVSISGRGEVGRAPPGRRTLTASTHVALSALRADPAATVARVQATMRATLAARLPEAEPAGLELPASPRTFARFTQRVGGAVGGARRLVGFGSYRQLGPAEVAERLWLVGDSTFPGQSTLATAIGGHRVAEAVIAKLG